MGHCSFAAHPSGFFSVFDGDPREVVRMVDQQRTHPALPGLRGDSGFEVVRDHPVLPRLRLEMPPAKGLLSAEAVEKLLSGAEAHVR